MDPLSILTIIQMSAKLGQTGVKCVNLLYQIRHMDERIDGTRRHIETLNGALQTVEPVLERQQERVRQLDDEPRRAHLNIVLREISTALTRVDESLQNLHTVIEALGSPSNWFLKQLVRSKAYFHRCEIMDEEANIQQLSNALNLLFHMLNQVTVLDMANGLNDFLDGISRARGMIREVGRRQELAHSVIAPASVSTNPGSQKTVSIRPIESPPATEVTTSESLSGKEPSQEPQVQDNMLATETESVADSFDDCNMGCLDEIGQAAPSISNDGESGTQGELTGALELQFPGNLISSTKSADWGYLLNDNFPNEGLDAPQSSQRPFGRNWNWITLGVMVLAGSILFPILKGWWHIVPRATPEGFFDGYSSVETLLCKNGSLPSKLRAVQSLEYRYHSTWTDSRIFREQMAVGHGCSVLHFLASASQRHNVASNAQVELSHLLDFALKSGVPVDPIMSTVDSNGGSLALSPLAITCLSNPANSISAGLLIQAGANVNHNVSKRYPSILTLIISMTPDGSASDCLEVMLRHQAIVSRETIMVASILGKRRYVELLHNHAQHIDIKATTAKPDLHSALLEGNLPLFWAAMSTSPNLEKGQSHCPDGVDSGPPTESNVTPLMLSAKTCCVDCAKALLDAGAKIHASSSQGNTALHNAFFSGCLGVAKVLIEHGASTRAENNEHNVPLHGALYNGKLDLVEWALDENHYGVDERKSDGVTLLMYSAAILSREGVVMLRGRGADTHLTALHPSEGVLLTAGGFARLSGKPSWVGEHLGTYG